MIHLRSISKNTKPKLILGMFGICLFTAILPSCKVKEGCAASQKGFTNNMERTKKRGKTALFPKTMTKKMKGK